jgi:signal transduction histidine kinase
MTKHTSILIFLLFLPGLLYAQNKTIVFNGNDEVRPIGESVYVMEDASGNLRLENVLAESYQKKFRLNKYPVLNLGVSSSTFWLKFDFINRSQSECLLEIANASVEDIEIFIPDEKGKYQSQKMGYAYPYSHREINVSTLLTSIDATTHRLVPKTIYLRVKSNLVLILPLTLVDKKKFLTINQNNNLIGGFYLGLVLILIISNWFTFILFREKIYLYYIVSLFCFGFINLSFFVGYTFQYLGDWTSVLYYHGIVFTSVGYISLLNFTRHILNIPHHAIINKIFYALILVFVIVILLSLFRVWVIAYQLVEFTSILTSLVLQYCAVIALKNREKSTIFFAIGIFVFTFSLFVITAVILDWLPYNFFTRNSLVLGSAFEMMFFSAAMAVKIWDVEVARREAEESLTKILSEENDKLEKLVQIRTEEITAQNEEITTQNEELAMIQEELVTHRDTLSEQNEKLKEAQKLIEEYNQKLEIEVAKRTEDLQKANTTLIQYNRQLEQFAFITAHNLRSPVARILGLGSLMELPNINFEETLGIIEKLVLSTRQLDEIIKDLNDILSVSKTPEIILMPISLSEEVDKLKTVFEKEITDYGIDITTDFSELETVHSVPAYFSSILYNLINNAIKYRCTECKPVIHIKSQYRFGYVCISVADNGIGIDLEKYRNKLFLPYQRFHLHIEGKGLGLYLVKAQTESLNGKIEVESVPDRGSTFFIYLPS